jgi:hypothetical protein
MTFVATNNCRTTTKIVPSSFDDVVGSGIHIPDPQHCFRFWLRITSFLVFTSSHYLDFLGSAVLYLRYA